MKKNAQKLNNCFTELGIKIDSYSTNSSLSHDLELADADFEKLQNTVEKNFKISISSMDWYYVLTIDDVYNLVDQHTLKS